MKTLLFLLLTICLIHQNAFSQTIFTNVYTDTAVGHNVGGNIIIKCHDGNYLTVGDRHIYTPFFVVIHGVSTNLYINKTTPEGQLIWSQQYYINDGAHHMNVYEDTLSGEFTILGEGFNAGFGVYSSEPVLVRVDSLGNMLSDPTDAAIMQQDHLHSTANAIKSGSNRYTYLTRDRVSNGGPFFPPTYTSYTGLITLDSNRNIVQQNQFPYGIYPNISQGGLIQTPDEGFLFGEARSGSGISAIFITKANNFLIKEWEIKLIDSATLAPKKIYATSDGNYILLCEYSSYGQVLSMSTQLHKFTPLGVLLWSKEYDNIGGNQLLERGDGSFYLASNFHDTLTNNIDIGVLIVDSLGDVMNQKIYTYPNRDRVGGILKNECEGFVLNGEIDYMNLDTFIGPGKCIIIADTLSMLSNPCASVNTVEIASLASKIYPNPFSDHILIDFYELNSTEYSFSLFNVNGQLIQSQKLYNVKARIEIEKSIPNGIYFYKIQTLDGRQSVGKLVKQP